MITIVDYGVGNLFSLKSSFACVGEAARVSGDPEEIRKADKVVLPGVGAFGDAAAKLRALQMDGALRDAAGRGTPLLGICLGMQLLFDVSFEYGEHRGLGLIPGKVTPMAGVIPASLKIPHIGCVYFVHSYFASDCAPAVIATAEYGPELTAAVERDNVYGCQ